MCLNILNINGQQFLVYQGATKEWNKETWAGSGLSQDAKAAQHSSNDSVGPAIPCMRSRSVAYLCPSQTVAVAASHCLYHGTHKYSQHTCSMQHACAAANPAKLARFALPALSRPFFLSFMNGLLSGSGTAVYRPAPLKSWVTTRSPASRSWMEAHTQTSRGIFRQNVCNKQW